LAGRDIEKNIHFAIRDVTKYLDYTFGRYGCFGMFECYMIHVLSLLARRDATKSLVLAVTCRGVIEKNFWEVEKIQNTYTFGS
jgi:hypothetical protein